MKKMSIVYQTHWDREWYYTVDTYNIRLLQVMKRIIHLLDQDEIAYFVFDGQVRALEDYLSICEPTEKEKVLFYVEQKRLIIGPWYVLSDEFLVSGESLIRNLEMGMKKAIEFGNTQTTGYLPDTFGHISQMPQILRQFQIDSAILWRGVVPQDIFFNWDAPNGDSVFTVYLKEGYYQPIIEQQNGILLFDSFVKKMKAFTSYDHLLLTNGGDHLMPAYHDIKSRITGLETQHDCTIEISTYEQYLAQVHNREHFDHIQGELRDNKGIYVLPNVLSTRYYLKQTNQRLEDDMRILEALIAKTSVFTPYPHQRLLDTMWETLLLNHPHDSICGCSIDDVHTEMDTRSMKLTHQIEDLLKERFVSMNAYPNTRNYDLKAAIFSDYSTFSVYNPTVRRINHFVKVKIFVKDGNPLQDHFVVSDGIIDYTTTIINQEKTREFESPLEDAPQFIRGIRYTVIFRVKDLQGLSARTYFLKPGTPLYIETANDVTIENDKIKVVVENDCLTFEDKQQQKTYRNMNQYISTLDNGDSYNYSKPDEDLLSKAKIVQAYSRKSTHYQELHLTYELVIPEQLDETFQRPSTNNVTNQFTVVVSLFTDSHEVFFDVSYHNRAKQHRTRVLFDANERIKTHYSDTAFDVVERTVRTEQYTAAKQQEVPVVVDPSYSKIALSNGIVFHHRGMQEYQMRDNEHTTVLEVTMMRSIGELSRDDLHSRGGGAGPSLPTPQAQMIGTYDYQYSIVLGSDSPYQEHDLFRNKLMVTKGSIEEDGSFLELTNPLIQLSSIRSLNGYTEVRVFNPTTEDQPLELLSVYPKKSITIVDLKGNPLDKDIHIIQAKEIRTYHIVFEPIQTVTCDVLITGGSIGGVQAALSLLEQGKQVILTEETTWIGGQLTSQAVPLDEHPFIEDFGCTKRYRQFRNNARQYYHNTYHIKEDKQNDRFNPGNAWVTRLAFEPQVANLLFINQLQPYLGNQLEIYYKTKPVRSIVKDDVITQVTIQNTESHQHLHVQAAYYIDATDIGELLPVTNTEYTTGRESKQTTNECHALETEDKEDLQPVTHIVAMKWEPSNTKPIEKPIYYDYFKSMITPYSKEPVLSEYGPDSTTKKERKFNIYQGRLPLWTYRRFFDPTQFNNPDKPEMTTINWPQNDYFMGNIFDDEMDDIHRIMAKELTRSFVYYLQTEVPRHDHGYGYPEMVIQPDVLGTTDGFAMYPYIRESRRIKALKTITEEDVSAQANESIPHVEDSVGVGCYHIDLHITTRSHQFFFDHTWPFEIPLGAMIPIRIKNLIPASKNIGTTHLTNGCFRLHPVEWNVGEVAGYFVDYLLQTKQTPQEFYSQKEQIKAFQKLLVEKGIELSWPQEKVHVI